MAHINLLPWREELRAEQQKEFVVMVVGAVIIAGLLVLLVHLRLAGMIDAQERRNTFLENEIAELDKQIAEIKDLETTKNTLLTYSSRLSDAGRTGIPAELLSEIFSKAQANVILWLEVQQHVSLSLY